MNKFIYIFIYLFLFPLIGVGNSYPEVIFENSLVSGSFARSRVEYEGNSWVENVNKRLPVSDTLFFTPGNSLSLKYISAPGGKWKTRINYNRQKNHHKFNPTDQLSFFVFINSRSTSLQDIPKVFVKLLDGRSDTVELKSFLPNYVTNKWIQVKIPCHLFNPLNNGNSVIGIGFIQNRSSSNTHHIFIDQIEFLPSKYSEVKLNSPAILTDAIPYDKMVHLKWQLPLSPSIRYVKIYRSTDGKDFNPVAIRPIYMQSCLDVIPKTGQKYYYKIVWLDNNYRESPASIIKEAETKDLTDFEILKLVQAAHINYFIENFDVNSGMYIPFRSRNKAIVSTRETAGAILSLIVGIEKDLVSRQIVLQRISKITYFLMRAQNRYGIFPAYFDGRKGLPEYRKGTLSYDVQATSAIIEALLVAREYFSGTDEMESDLRNRITALYDQINWQELVDENSLLRSRFAIINNEIDSVNRLNLPLNGLNDAINTYLLAISSKHHSLPVHTYADAIYHNYGIQRVEDIDELLTPDIYTDSLNIDLEFFKYEDSLYSLMNNSFKDTIIKNSIFNPISLYGVSLPFGELSGSLLDLYKPFMTIRPDLIRDGTLNWNEVLRAYTTYIKRRDNEYGVGSNSTLIWGFYQHRDSTGNYRLNPAIAPSSIIVDKDLGLASIVSLFEKYGQVLFTEYGFRSWVDLRNNDESEEYLAMNQAAIVVMIENAETGLIWKLYEQIPELKTGREKLF